MKENDIKPVKSNRSYTMPAINRGHMTSQPWNNFFDIQRNNNSKEDALDKVAQTRRTILLLLTISFSLLASWLIQPQILNTQDSITDYIQ